MNAYKIDLTEQDDCFRMLTIREGMMKEISDERLYSLPDEEERKSLRITT